MDSIVSATSALSLWCSWVMYRRREWHRVANANVAGLTSSLISPYTDVWLRQSIIFVVHCPPFLRDYAQDAGYLNVVVFFRIMFTLAVLRDRSRLYSFLGRTVARLANIPFTVNLMLKSHLHDHPLSTVSVAFMLLSLILSLVFMAAEGISMEEATWFAFVTSATLGYGDYAPKTSLGRIITCFMLLNGLVSTSLFVAVFSQRVNLTEREHRVMTVIQQQQDNQQLRHRAALILRAAWKLRKVSKGGSLFGMIHSQRELFECCQRFRRIRFTVKSRAQDAPCCTCDHHAIHMGVRKMMDEAKLRMTDVIDEVTSVLQGHRV